MKPQATRHLVYFTMGLAATVAQVLLLRELVVDVAGDEAAIGAGLALWLVGIALGAAVARRREAASSGPDAAGGLALLAVLPSLAIVAGRVLCRWTAPPAGEIPGLTPTLLLAATTLTPVGAAVGWTFTRLASDGARAWRDGEAVARLYVVEALGSIAGGLAVTTVAGRVSPLQFAALVGAASGVVAFGASRAGLLGRQGFFAAATLVCALTAGTAGSLDRLSERARFAATAPSVPFVASLDTPYQHLALGGGEVRHLYANGQYVASFPDPYSAEGLGHLMALLAPRPRNVLLLGGLEKGVLPALLRHGVVRLTIVEADTASPSFLRPYLAPADREALGDSRVQLVHDDPRGFLSRPGTERFDFILLLGPDPATLLRARLATVEFYRLVASRLRPDGALVVGLPAVPTVLAGETEALAATVVRSMREALPVVLAALSTESFAVAGWDPGAVTLDPARLAARWRARGVASPSFDEAVIPLLLSPERVGAQQARLDRAVLEAASSLDDRPISFLHALARRQQIVSGGAGRAIRLAVSLPPLLLATIAFLPAAFVAGRLVRASSTPVRARTLASHAVAVTGAAGLGWSLLLLFSFQTQKGALYGALGALVAAFMLGIALGGAAVSFRRARGALGQATLADGLRALRLALAAAAAFGASLPFALTAAMRASRGAPIAVLPAHAVLLLLAGFATGGVFPLAAGVRLLAGDRAGEAAGRLETADHAGAAVAALLGAVLFVPLLGLQRFAWLLSALLVVAFALTALSTRSQDTA